MGYLIVVHYYPSSLIASFVSELTVVRIEFTSILSMVVAGINARLLH